jgi:hypothetical protein
MHVTRFAAAAAILVISACGGTTEGVSGGLAPCSLSAGTYLEHLGVDSDAGSDAYCASPPDETVTLSGAQSYSGFNASTGSCTGGFDSATCTQSQSCTETTSSGDTITTTFAFTIQNSSAYGSETITITSPNVPATACSFTLSITKI